MPIQLNAVIHQLQFDQRSDQLWVACLGKKEVLRIWAHPYETLLEKGIEYSVVNESTFFNEFPIFLFQHNPPPRYSFLTLEEAQDRCQQLFEAFVMQFFNETKR